MDVIVGLCTYKRPEALKACLTSLQNLAVPDEVNLTLVVVDNEVNRVNQEIIESFGCSYIAESRPGLVYARNALLDFVAQRSAEYLGIVDDDELVPEDWLSSMLASMADTEADALAGPVRVLIPENSPKCLNYAYQFSKVKEYKQTATLPMGNVFMKTALLHKGLRFDLSFNHTGGEDVDFFRRASQQGARLFRTPYGEVQETLMPEKASLYAFFKRVMRVASVHYKTKYPKIELRFLLEVLLSVLEIMIFIVLVPFTLLSDKFKVKWVKVMAKFCGRLLSRKKTMLHHYGK